MVINTPLTLTSSNIFSEASKAMAHHEHFFYFSRFLIKMLCLLRLCAIPVVFVVFNFFSILTCIVFDPYFVCKFL